MAQFKVTKQGFVGNLIGTASFAEKVLNSTKTQGYTADDFAAAVHTHSIDDVTNLSASLAAKQDVITDLDTIRKNAASGSAAKVEVDKDASLNINPGTGFTVLFTASFAGKTASTELDFTHTHSDYEKTDNKVTALDSGSTDVQYPSAKCVYDVVSNTEKALSGAINEINTWRVSNTASFAGTASYATLAASASHASEIQWSGITDKPTASVANLDSAAAFVVASASALDKTHQDAWNSAEQNAKSYTDTEIGKLDASYPATASKYISAITQIDGIVTASFESLPVAAEYTITKDTSSGDYAAVYHLTKDGTAVGEAINIPKDMVIKAAAVITYNGTDTKITIGGVEYTVEGTHAAGKYVVMIVQNAAAGASQIWIDVKDLVDVYTAGNGISISAANVVSAVAKSGDAYIEVTADGIASKGIDTAIEAAAVRAIASGSASLTEYSGSQATVNTNLLASASAAESNSKAYAKPAVDYVAASASLLDSVKDKVVANSGSWDSAATWAGTISGSLAATASMSQSGYNLTANFRGQSATATINSASYAAAADKATTADTASILVGSTASTMNMYFDATGSLIINIPE